MKTKRRRTAFLWAVISGLMIQTVIPGISVYGSVEDRVYASAGKNRKATASDAGKVVQIPQKLQARASSTGNLWNSWTGDMDFDGEGTKLRPFQLSSLAHLMGLSELVAAGNDFQGVYFELTQDVDLGNLTLNNGSWNPIGWYANEEEFGSDITQGFSGNFD